MAHNQHRTVLGGTGDNTTELLRQIKAPDGAALVVVASRDVILQLDGLEGVDSGFDTALEALAQDDSHLIHSLRMGDGHGHRTRPVLVCTGKTAVATLYSSYALLEHLGARFYLHGDVLPAVNTSLLLSLPAGFSRTFTPRFSRRGLQVRL